jgi:transcriptional regulator with XRE-family HTH domain
VDGARPGVGGCWPGCGGPAENGPVTFPAPTGDRQQKAAMRAAARRRQAADLLRVTASITSYSAVQLGNGLSPEEARRAVQEVAGELAVVVVSLRRLARLPARERAGLAVQLAALGVGTQEIADRLGVSAHTAWNYQRGRRGDGQPWSPA